MVNTRNVRDPFIECLKARIKGHVPKPVTNILALQSLGDDPVPQTSACGSSVCSGCPIKPEALRGKWQPATQQYSCINIYCEPSHDWSTTRPGVCDCCGLEVVPSTPGESLPSACDIVSFGGVVLERIEAWASHGGVGSPWWEMDDGSIEADFTMPNYGLQDWLIKRQLALELPVEERKLEICHDPTDLLKVLAEDMIEDIAKTLLRTQQDFIRWMMSLGWAPFRVTIEVDRNIYKREHVLGVILSPETTGVIRPAETLTMDDLKSAIDAMPSRFKK